MRITALGYLGFESTNTKAWEAFGPEVFGPALGEPGEDGTIYVMYAGSGGSSTQTEDGQ